MASSRGPALTIAIAIACAAAIGAVRGPLFAAQQKVKETADVYVLPPPEQVVTLSLGYRAAVADILWAHVLVSQGLHTQEKRRFGNLTLLLDAINALDPMLREPYLLADALITFQANDTPREEVYKAREILERGVAARPLDAELWLVLGQFVAFVAPASYLEGDPAEYERWRVDGSKMLARAAELGGANSDISWQALGGASILERAGQRDASIEFYRRTLAVTDDEALRQQAEAHLERLLRDKRSEVDRLVDAQRWANDRRRAAAFQETWRRDLPFATRGTLLLLGPPRDAAWCAGGERSRSAGCAPTWREWAERQER